MDMVINWNSLINGAISSIINGVAVFLALRAVGRMVDGRKETDKPKGKI